MSEEIPLAHEPCARCGHGWLHHHAWTFLCEKEECSCLGYVDPANVSEPGFDENKMCPRCYRHERRFFHRVGAHGEVCGNCERRPDARNARPCS